MSPTIVTLLTDFGADGPYVAAMKGVLLGMNRSVRLVDISHAIEPQNIHQAALCLAQTAPYFPPGTIHVVVVDPGVGTARRLICLLLHEQYFLAPDNGVLSWMAENVLANWNRNQTSAEGAVPRQIYHLTQPRFWQGIVSNTFHGRDILAPVAGHLSLGVSPRDLGPEVADYVRLHWPAVESAGGKILGEIVAVDRFGNLITNIRRGDLPPVRGATDAAWTVTLAADTWPLRQTYADAPEGEPLALFGSSDLLEIAVRNGNAAARLRAGVGQRVSVKLI